MPLDRRRSPEHGADDRTQAGTWQLEYNGPGEDSGCRSQPDRIVDQSDEALPLQGLGHVRDSSIGQALLAQRGLVVGGYDDDRQGDIGDRELALHIPPGEARHPIIEDHAVGQSCAQRIEKLLAGSEHIDIEVRGAKHPRERPTH